MEKVICMPTPIGSKERDAQTEKRDAYDRNLMKRVAEGDHEALSELFDRYYIAVRSIARKFLRNDIEYVPDIIQETFIDVFQSANTYDPSRGTVKTWISYLVFHRTQKRRIYLGALMRNPNADKSGIDELARATSVPDDRLTPDRWMRRMDFRKCLHAVLTSLNEKQRKTIILHFFQEKEMGEIAKEIGENVGNTRNHLYRGLAKLRDECIKNHLLSGYSEYAIPSEEEPTGS
jgi:RNA polymerase sigma-70 factor (ECF subfamily)